jgi:predicted permease
MYAGVVLTVVAAIAPFASGDLLADHIRDGYPTYTQGQVDTAVTTWLVVLSVVGALGLVSWITTIWAVRAGKRWARWMATALFAIGTTVALTALLTKDTSGDTGLAPVLGWIGMLPCLAGVAVVALLWRGRGQDRQVAGPRAGGLVL